MTHDEFEECKRQLEEQHRAGMALLDAAYRHQLRVLELVWTSASRGETDRPLPIPAPVSSPPPLPAAAAAKRRPRRSAGELDEEVAAVLPGLPNTFDVRQLRRALGYEPDRGSLHRVLQRLMEQNALAVQSHGSGTQPAKYRKRPADPSPSAK